MKNELKNNTKTKPQNEPKIIYYTDELNDEFSTAQITPKVIGDDYKYLGTWARPLIRAVLYYVIAKPLGTLFIKLKYHHKIVNKEVLKEAKGKGYFLYGNHTNAAADPFIPQLIDVNKNLYVIVHPNNVSMPVLGHLTPALGALPLPDTYNAAKNFNCAIKHHIEKGHTVLIYPEAHIWPYYTGIRPFKSASFGYPVNLDAPVYCFTNTYQEPKKQPWPFTRRTPSSSRPSTPRMVSYVDGPFYPDKSLPKAQQKEDLRNRVYEAMVERSKNSNVELIRYIKKTEQ